MPRLMFWCCVVLFWAGIVHMAHCQTVCVEPPLQAIPDADLQEQVEHLFQARGIQTSCERYDYAVSFYDLRGSAIADVTNFAISYAATRGVVVGTLVTNSPRIPFGAWTMTLRRPGEVLTVARVHSSSLKRAVKETAKLAHPVVETMQ